MTLGAAIQAVAWDIDGTLLDSEPLHHQALLAACRLWGADLSDLGEQDFRGVQIDDVWRRVRDRLPRHVQAADWLGAVEAEYIGCPDRPAAMPEAIETVKALALLGLPQLCVSNSSRRIVDVNLASLGLTHRFAVSISRDDVRIGKPDAEPYRTGAHRMGIEPGRILAIEDSLTGILSARSAGLPVISYQPDGADVSAAVHCIRRLSTVLQCIGSRRPHQLG